jgi:signal transduction histidine kinase
LEFQSIQFVPKVLHEAREVLEDETREFLSEKHPSMDYQGMVGLGVDPTTGQDSIIPQPVEPFYFPIHYLEPFEGNEASLDINVYSDPHGKANYDSITSTWAPLITRRRKLVQEKDLTAYGIIMTHPGIPLSTRNDTVSDSVAQIVIRIPDLLASAVRDSLTSEKVYIFDSTDSDILPEFFGGTEVRYDHGQEVSLMSLQEVDLESLRDLPSQYTDIEVDIANRKWTIAVASLPGSYEPDYFYVILVTLLVLAASCLLAMWFYSQMNRIDNLHEIQARAEREKALIIVDKAREQAVSERKMNEYIAHEVRNPLASAIAALSFVSSITKEHITDTQARQVVEEDIAIVDASHKHINELLRNMLDMNRAASKKMKVELAPTDLRQDVLQPVASILFLRGSKVEVVVDCPPDLGVTTDCLRLKQVILNLAVNACKFVMEGFIRLKASVVEGNVHVFVEDSGPGIPMSKRGHLFAKFQESLDLLSQGTGIGLSLCKHIIDLLQGEIVLVSLYDSGIENCPGSRFIINLRAPPIHVQHHFEKSMSTIKDEEHAAVAEMLEPLPISNGNSLPDTLSVLFVDDDMMLRKLFCRSLQRVAPDWSYREASSGETALQLADSHAFDVIFMDQYMPSVHKQLLGTETVRLLRSHGFEGIICGLSANDMETEFLNAGASAFMLKPFPCEKEKLRQALTRVLHGSKTE